MDISIYIIRSCGVLIAFGRRKNKANLSLGEQSQLYLAHRFNLGVLKKQSQFSMEKMPAGNGEISNTRLETNRNDVNIFRKLKISVNSWYFADH